MVCCCCGDIVSSFVHGCGNCIAGNNRCFRQGCLKVIANFQTAEY